MKIDLQNLQSLGSPKIRRRKFGVASMLFTVIIGLLFIGAGLFGFQKSKIDPSWTRVDGHITSSSTNPGSDGITYTPVVTYSVDGKDYQVSSSISTSSYPSIGQSKQVAYNPVHPDQSKVVGGGGLQLLILIFPVTGAALILFGIVSYVKSLRRNADIQSLTQSGIKHQGVIIDIQTQINEANNGANNTSYKIVVAAPDINGTIQNYASDSLAGIGGISMADFRTNPIPIDVYLDPANPANYYVDVSEVPNLTADRIRQLIQSAMPHSQSVATPPIVAQPLPSAPVITPTNTGPTQPPPQSPLPPTPQA